MTATALDRFTVLSEGKVLEPDVMAATKIPGGVMVQVNATGFAVNASATIANRMLGISERLVDNSGGASGDLKARVQAGLAGWYGNSAAGDLITIADVKNDCYVVDNQTVAKTDNGGARPKAGKILAVDAGLGVLVFFPAA